MDRRRLGCRTRPLRGVAAWRLLVALGLALAPAAPRAAEATETPAPAETVRLSGTVPAALASAVRLPASPADSPPVTLTVVLRRADQPGFDAFLRDVHDPGSAQYRRYLDQAELAARFGPTRDAYDAVIGWLESRGLALVRGSANRLTITVEGVRARVEQAFGVSLDDYRLGDRAFHANDRDPALPAAIAPHVRTVVGLTNLARPVRAHPMEVMKLAEELREQGLLDSDPKKNNLAYTCWLALALTEVDLALPSFSEGLFDQLMSHAGFFGLSSELNAVTPAVTLLRYLCVADQLNMLNRLAAGIPLAAAPTEAATSRARPGGGARAPAAESAGTPLPGAGQTIGLLQFDSFHPSDVQDFLSLIGHPERFAQLSRVHVAGGAGAPGPDQSEVLLDVAAVMSLAPGANVVVYDGPFTGRGSFQTMLNAMIDDGVDIISNSWGYCEDQTTAADVESLDAILASAAAAGITVLTGSGDSGSTCLNGSPNTVHVPAGAPHITAVGGTSPTRSVGGTYGSETWWNGATDLVPGGQGGFGTSRFFARPAYQNGLTASPMRSVPDVTAPADPATGYFICQASAGGCPTNLLYGGTSVAAPIWAAIVAVLNHQGGQPLGFLNPLLYPLANTPAFHSPAQMGTDFAHVGLGTPNVGALHLALTGGSAGPVSDAKSVLGAFPPLVVADGQSTAGVVVLALDAEANAIAGQSVQLTMNPGAQAVITAVNGVTDAHNGAARYLVTSAVPETVTFSATVNGIPLAQHPVVIFVPRPAAAGSITATPGTVTADGVQAATITVSLQDALGQPSPGKRVGLSQGGGSSILSGAGSTTNAAGQAHFTATSTVAETVTYTAVDLTDGNLAVPGSATVQWINAGANPCHIGEPTPAPGYTVTTFASGFRTDLCFAPFGLAFDQQGDLIAANRATGFLYRFGPLGGAADPGHQINAAPIAGRPTGLAFAKDGRLYATLIDGAAVVELDPVTGAVVRTVATVFNPLALATDPVSGDLFVGTFEGVQRLAGFANGPGTLTPYYAALFTDGIAFAADGTLYVKSGCCPDFVARVGGTSAPDSGQVTIVAFVDEGDGIAIEPNPADPSKPFLYVNGTNGTLTRIDTTAAPATTSSVFTGGSRGDFVAVGPDGCLYATQTDRVLKVTRSDGACRWQPDSPAPRIALTPAVAAGTQGGTVTLTATLQNAAAPAGVPVTLLVAGSNTAVRHGTTDAAGAVSFAYTGVRTGSDTAVAMAAIGGAPLQSNAADVSWVAGPHATFLSVNASARSGAPGEPLTLVATLADVSARPVAALGGATIAFDLVGQGCSAVTDGAGTASCQITPTGPAGSYTLVATFGGTGAHRPSGATTAVDLLEASGGPGGAPGGDAYACYRSTVPQGQPRFLPVTKSLDDALGPPGLFDVKSVASVCHPARVNGSALVAPWVHQEAFRIAAHRGEPKFVKVDRVATDRFGTRRLTLTGPATLLDVTPTAGGGTPPPAFAGDPTGDPDVNRFKCYRARLAKGQPKFVPPAPPMVTDEFFPSGQGIKLTQISKLCLPVDKEGETPGAEARDAQLLCYRAQLVKGAPRFTPRTISTHSDNFGPHTLVARSVAELCVPAAVSAP